MRTELLRLASWRASRSGLEGQLAGPVTHRQAAARDVLGEMLEHVRPALTDAGDFAIVAGLLDDVLDRGNGARVQRQAYRRNGQALDVVREAIARTMPW